MSKDNAMNVNSFFDNIFQKNWKSNIRGEAAHKFDSLVEKLNSNKEAILDEVVNCVESMEVMKLEDKEEFTYSTFKKWLDYYIIEHIESAIEEE
jgi:hypothetical protein